MDHKWIRLRDLANAHIRKYQRSASRQLDSTAQSELKPDEIRKRQIEEERDQRRKELARERMRRFREKKRLEALNSVDHMIQETSTKANNDAITKEEIIVVKMEELCEQDIDVDPSSYMEESLNEFDPVQPLYVNPSDISNLNQTQAVKLEPTDVDASTQNTENKGLQEETSNLPSDKKHTLDHPTSIQEIKLKDFEDAHTAQITINFIKEQDKLKLHKIERLQNQNRYFAWQISALQKLLKDATGDEYNTNLLCNEYNGNSESLD